MMYQDLNLSREEFDMKALNTLDHQSGSPALVMHSMIKVAVQEIENHCPSRCEAFVISTTFQSVRRDLLNCSNLKS